MLKLNRYKINSKKITKQQRILLIADIHLWDNYNPKIINDIISQAQNIKPNFICICGDIIDQFRYLDNNKNLETLLKFLNNLANITTTLITLGSHDFFNLKKDKTQNIASEAIEYWHKIIKDNNNPNLILLDNEIYETNNLRIIGYTPSRDYYKNCEDTNTLINEINNYFNLPNKDYKYTILMCHTPRRITKNVLEQLKICSTIDLILSGHMHDGLLFPILKKLPTTIGLVSPERTLFPKNTRNKRKFTINNHEINLVITGGVIKFSNSAPHMLQKINFLYYNDIDLIEIDK